MITEESIIRGIEQRAFSVWTIGITDDPDRRAGEHKAAGRSVSYFRYWDVGSEAAARRIEKYFLDRGMNGVTGGGKSPHFVYIL